MLALGGRPLSITEARFVDQIESQTRKSDQGDSCRLENLYGQKDPRILRNIIESERKAYEQRRKAWEEDDKTWMDYLVENQNLWLLLNEDKISTLFYRQGTRSQIYNQERDVWMVCKLRQFCERFKPKRVVVIVGAAHVFGMKHLLDAEVIGSTRRPEDVLKDLATTESSPSSPYPAGDLDKVLAYYKVPERKGILDTIESGRDYISS